MELKKNLLTRKQVAEYFGVTYPTLKRMVDEGYLKAYKLGGRKLYFKEADLLSVFEKKKPR